MEETNQPESQTKGDQKNLYLILVVVVVFVLLVGWFMTRKNVSNVSEVSDDTSSEAPATSGSIAEKIMEAGETEEIREIVVEGNEFSFTPTSIKLTEGEKVKLTFKNTGKMSHDFVIDELEIETKTIQSGETDTVEFVAEDTGTYEFYCSVGKHKELGMKGEVDVE